jgi:hypothetical protein
MPANIMLPTNAKITALVCSGRSRPKVRYGATLAECQKASCRRDDDAHEHADDARLVGLRRRVVLDGEEAHAFDVLPVAVGEALGEERQRGARE